MSPVQNVQPPQLDGEVWRGEASIRGVPGGRARKMAGAAPDLFAVTIGHPMARGEGEADAWLWFGHQWWLIQRDEQRASVFAVWAATAMTGLEPMAAKVAEIVKRFHPELPPGLDAGNLVGIVLFMLGEYGTELERKANTLQVVRVPAGDPLAPWDRVEAILAEIMPQIHFGGVEAVRLVLRKHIREAVGGELGACAEIIRDMWTVAEVGTPECQALGEAMTTIQKRAIDAGSAWAKVDAAGATIPSEVV